MAQTLKAGEAVIEMLRQEGVSHMFGIVGSSFLDILDPLFDRDARSAEYQQWMYEISAAAVGQPVHHADNGLGRGGYLIHPLLVFG